MGEERYEPKLQNRCILPSSFDRIVIQLHPTPAQISLPEGSIIRMVAVLGSDGRR